ncbi:MAG: hypothetical protein JHC33_10225 [Ignisphaera sp.]|nr:hypothetical protein [Ignisphaera sp.]
MSTFLGFESALITAGATASSMQATFSSIMSTYGWQVLRQAVIPTSVIGTIANPSNLFDQSSTTTSVNSTLPKYVGATINSGFTPTIMYVQADFLNPQYGPLTFTLDYSTDVGSSWNTLQTFTNQVNWTSGERRKFIISGATSQTYWRMNITSSTSGSNVYLAEWCLEDANGNWLTNVPFFDCIPPASDTGNANPIGNSYARDILRWSFTTSAISFRPLQELLTPLPEICIWTGATAGAVTVSTTINGSTVSYVGSANNSAIKNSRGLFEACKASNDANFTAWAWIWNNTLLTSTGGPGNFTAIQNTPAMNIMPTSSNITVQMRGTSVYSVPLVQGALMPLTVSITTDCTNGWIYYMQLNARGIAISSKTNNSYYTPVHACWGNNADAIAQIPTADLAAYGIPCTPIELFVGTDNANTSVDALAWPTHVWGVAQTPGNASRPGIVDVYNDTASNSTTLFTHHLFGGHMQDYSMHNTAYNWATWGPAQIQLAADGYFQGGDSGLLWSIHKLGCRAQDGWDFVNAYGGNYGGNYVRWTGPYLPGLDWYKFSGSAPANEQLVVSASNDYTAIISTTGLTTDITISVNSTTGFPSSGWLVLEGEIIQYTGITSNSFTGCTRGKYNTTPINPLSGTTINIGAWYVFMVYGLIFGGYQVPS